MAELDTITRKTFAEIAPTSWEHPADRAALQALRAVPGFDLFVRKVIGFMGERPIRMLFLANAVRVGPNQFPRVHALHQEVQATLDWPEDVELYVSQTPYFNAGAYGVDKPFIVLHSAALDLLDEREIRVLLGHELGHVMSGHALYRTMLAIILMIGFQNFPFLSGIAVLPIRLALLEWSRKSELSSDRAGLLACQDPDDAVRMFLKASGGTISNRETLNLEAYKEQVSAYQLNDNFDAVFKALNLLVQTHPFHTLRAAALLDWAKSEEYQKILAGDYRRRSERQSTSSYGNDFSEAASYYAGEASKRAGEFSQVAMGAVQQATQFARRTAQDAREAVRDAAEDAAARVSSVIERRK